MGVVGLGFRSSGGLSSGLGGPGWADLLGRLAHGGFSFFLFSFNFQFIITLLR